MKKQIKSVIAIVITTALAVASYLYKDTLLSFIPTDFSNVDMIYETVDLSLAQGEVNVRYYYHTLSDNAKKAYTLILPQLYNHTYEIEIPYLTGEELEELNYAISYDNPDLICYAAECNFKTVGNKYYFYPVYAHSFEECEQLCTELETAVSLALSKAVNCQTDFEKEKFVHDYVCDVCEYSLADELKITVYDTLIGKRAVCEGYSRTTQLLLNKLGVENYLVVGEAINDDGETVGHMWNVVRIDSENYYLDVTWDDTQDENGPLLKKYLYFNLSEQQISKNHYNISPKNNNCTSEKLNYAKMNGMIYDGYNSDFKEGFEKQILKNYSEGINWVEIYTTGEKAYNDISKNLIDNDGISKIVANAKTKQSGIGYSKYNCYTDDKMFYMQIVFY